MAATATIRANIELDGLGVGLDSMSVRFQDTIAPEELFKGYQVIGTTVANLDFGGIAVTKVRGVMIRAIIGTVGILVNDVGTGTPVATAGNIVIPINGFAYIPIAGGLTAAYTIRIVGSSATTAIEYFIYGQET